MTSKRTGLRKDKQNGVKARAKAKRAIRHSKYMAAHKSGKPKKTSRKDRGLKPIISE